MWVEERVFTFFAIQKMGEKFPICFQCLASNRLVGQKMVYDAYLCCTRPSKEPNAFTKNAKCKKNAKWKKKGTSP
jgi:hypothetical protein